MQDYSSKGASYFSEARSQIAPLLPAKIERVLEVGCGTGGTLAWLKSTGRASYTVGIELFAPAADQARQVADAAYCLDIEREPLPADLGRFDLVLCLDVLEHLIDPWGAVNLLVREQLGRGGTLLVSVPNVRHHSVLLPLLLHGQWEYQDRGLLDRTHLHFFTRSSALQLLTHPLLSEPRCVPTGFEPGSRKRHFNRLTGGFFTEFLAFHYLLSATKLRDA